MKDPADAIMMFAAGFGTRMGSLTKDTPKPLIPVAGRPLIDRSLELARAADPGRIVVNTHYLAEKLEGHLDGTGVLISRETPEILDTGGGLKAALPFLGSGPVFTMNTDAIWSGPNPLHLLSGAWDPSRMDALLVCVPVGSVIGHGGPGDFTADGAGRIRRGAGLVYGGVQILKTDGLSGFSERSFSLNHLWDRMQADGRLYAVTYPGKWCDVGHPDGIRLAEKLLEGPDV